MTSKKRKTNKKLQKQKVCKESTREKLSVLCNEFMEDRSKANNLIEVFDLLQTTEEGEICIVLETINNMIERVILRDIRNAERSSVLIEYENWLNTRISEYEDYLRSLLSHQNQEISTKSLDCLTHMLRYSSQFNTSLLITMEKLLSDENSLMLKFIDDCKTYMDLRKGSLECLKLILSQDTASVYASNAAHFMLSFTLPQMLNNTNKFLHDSPKPRNSFSKVLKKLYSDNWELLVRQPLPPKVCKQVLSWLPEHVLPHLGNPLCVTDLFMESFNFGGGMSVLALEGIFILMNQYNLEYPEFYSKVYSLLTPESFNSPKFFSLLDLFLSSTHISESLVSGFIKKLCRLALISPAHITEYLILFVKNLLIRNPSLIHLIHSPQKENCTSDSYDESIRDPSKSSAETSSLWELEMLTQHVLPSIANSASFISKSLPEIESSLKLASSADNIVRDREKIHDETPTTFQPPQKLFNEQTWSGWS